MYDAFFNTSNVRSMYLLDTTYSRCTRLQLCDPLFIKHAHNDIVSIICLNRIKFPLTLLQFVDKIYLE